MTAPPGHPAQPFPGRGRCRGRAQPLPGAMNSVIIIIIAIIIIIIIIVSIVSIIIIIR